MTAINIHATCVALGRKGVLLLGASGAGKSDLALRLIDGGATLVADDRTDLFLKNGKLFARAPASIAGLLEVRGLGIVKLPRLAQAPVTLVVQLGATPARLPERQFYTQKGADPVPMMTMDGREAAATAKIRLVLARGLFTESNK